MDKIESLQLAYEAEKFARMEKDRTYLALLRVIMQKYIHLGEIEITHDELARAMFSDKMVTISTDQNLSTWFKLVEIPDLSARPLDTTKH